VKLIVLKNNKPYKEITVDTSDPFENYEVFVGRSEDCHVRIDDPIISRHHFVIKKEDSIWFCERLSQLGSVYINGPLITKHQVRSNDEIKFGVYSIFVSNLEVEIIRESNSHVSETVVLKDELIEPEPNILIDSQPQALMDSVEVSAPASNQDDLGTDSFSSSISTVNDDEFNFHSSSDSSNEPIIQEETEKLAEDSNLFGSQDFEENQNLPSLTDEQGSQESTDEGTRFFKTFIHYELHISGEFAPYDRYQIDLDLIYIGRDPEKCQIILNDPDVSSVHAVIRKNYNEIYLEDLNSSNGTILNGERINKARINTGDEFLIGVTSFSLEVRSDLLESESHRLMPVESGQVIETEEIIEEEVTESNNINLSDDIQQEKSIIKRIWKDPVKRKKAVYALFLGALALLLLPEEEKEPKPTPKVMTKEEEKSQPAIKEVRRFSQELENARNVSYELGVSYFEQSRYDLAQIEFQKVISIDPDYKKVQSYFEQTKMGLKRIAELEEQRRAEEDRIKMKKIIDDLLVKAREAVKKREVQVAENLFSQIVEKDPENFELSQLKMELEAWQKEQERKALEIALKEAERKKMVDALSPGKTYYLKKEWHSAILKLEAFLKLKGMDEDLIKEGSEMLSEAKNQMELSLSPILSKARTLKEDQDLKSAFEAFLEVLKIDPTHAEALNEVDDIKNQLDARSRKIYREAIIAESLSLFTDAREKFQEVLQVSPTDSEYYKKASDKLKNYLE
jgi:pSer/pThr/pTyr-binding forkhead associated (FHA) protein